MITKEQIKLEAKYSDKIVEFINHYKKFEVSQKDMIIHMEVLVKQIIEEAKKLK